MTDRLHNSLASALKKAFSQDSRLPKLPLDSSINLLNSYEALASSHRLQGFDQRSSIGHQLAWRLSKQSRNAKTLRFASKFAARCVA